MAGHSHDDQHVTENKPVSFTVPFILAAVTLLIIIMFLSLCDPKAHHEGGHGGHEATEHATHGETAKPAEHHDAAAPAHEASHEAAAAEHPAEAEHH